MSLLDRRLNILTGKGGVGKSTLSAALALCAQKRGLRTLVCEVTAKERVANLLGAPDSGPEVRQIDKLIWSVHVQPDVAMREYGIMVLRFKAIYSAVFENRLVRYFLRAVPSLAEIVMLGKIWWHVTQERDERGKPRWDMVILDAPATGHGLSFLRTPQTILEIVNDNGPLVRDMKAMRDMLVDAKTTAVSIVTLPEEMPANEAIELHQALRAPEAMPGGRVFLNSFYGERFTKDERADLAHETEPELAAARFAAHYHGERQDLSRYYEGKLREGIGLPLTRIPHLYDESFGRAALERIAELIAPEV